MDNATFWKLIDSSRKKSGEDLDEQVEILRESLAKLDPKEIVDFDRIFTEYWIAAYTWDLWAAAYILGGGCSDDGFMDFRGWLICRGEKVYENAMENADSLARVVAEGEGEDSQYEGFQYVASQAWETKTRKVMDAFPKSKFKYPKKPAGASWSDEGDDLERRCPKLYRKFE